LRVAATAAVGGTAGCADDNTAGPSDGGTDTDTADVPATLSLEPVLTGSKAPVDVAFAPDTDRRYVLEQSGRILVHESTRLDEPFLDLRDAIDASGNEMGLLGIALHPDFESNRRLFLRYSAPRRSGTPANYNHTFVVAEFEATEDGRSGLRETERTILEIPQPQSNHNAGNVLFGPEGYLYVPVGDGGGANDQGSGHVEDWYDAVEGGNGQDVSQNLLGSILRLDVDATDDRYTIPEGNPLVGKPERDEHYAWGFRNPWGLSFDGSELYAADVGQSDYEEVDLVERGANYGWNVHEGTHCFGVSECPDRTPSDVRGGETFQSPVVEYPHPRTKGTVSGISIIGGHVYRGSELPELSGSYVFGDLQAKGELFASHGSEDDGLWPATTIDVEGTLRRIRAFGQDRDGELYVLGGGHDGTGLYRISPSA
jgi:glucose/arabinose dehydrogenase